ncbi:MarR family winged helix-turn-helix transcriptional regulator [Microbacterium azadirachtae]|uniref:MarR family winged helix-turn-helix transcriptional regulator n=1 Tax=Microbacterium azadirachtae TaxID=582680 RepID=UPI000880517E|nr:MarR family transcriptional regulator [Microbacterium azadirachtae]SDL65496.1 DNA-binding transcriptional regulator, MarR family [Microbacterium azadirachtae]SEF94810.1 DNA-binding transcriptional regulator, MarR family [Microbacterium azadirachtae]SEF97390.1 DNA-binding transcriptional regulator, MarR family [Microbacterium azadirachtae]
MTEKPPVADASAVSGLQTALDLRAVVARLLRQFREAGADETITPSQASALARLGKGGVSTVSALATAERVRPQSMAATVDALETLGLITRSQDPGDGRRQIIELTSAGRARVEGQKDAAAAWLEHALDGLDASELRTISAATALLERMLP